MKNKNARNEKQKLHVMWRRFPGWSVSRQRNGLNLKVSKVETITLPRNVGNCLLSDAASYPRRSQIKAHVC